MKARRQDQAKPRSLEMQTEISKTRSDLQNQIDDLQQGTHNTKSDLQDQLDDLQQEVSDLKEMLLGMAKPAKPQPTAGENMDFLRACLIRALHEKYLPAEKLIELALGMDPRDMTYDKTEELVQTLERAIDAHHAAAYRAKAVAV